MNEDNILLEIKNEYERAKQKYKRPFSSHHEAYAVILEELDELWDEIKKKEEQYDLIKQRKEAIQIGAMILRFINELT
jgi:hypothetical protein